MAVSLYEQRISDPINIRDFLTKWTEDLVQHRCLFTQSSGDLVDVSKEAIDMGISEEMYTELQDVCSTDELHCNKEQLSGPLLETLPDNTDLLSVNRQKELKIKFQDEKFRSQYLKRLKYRSIDLKMGINEKPLDEIPEEVRIMHPDVMLGVRMYKPFNKKENVSKLQPDVEFLVLASQPLTSLRDAYRCIADYSVIGELSENPEQPVETRTKDLFKSAMLYIEGVFYSDMRYPDCMDYSKVIRDWVEDRRHGIGPFTCQHMQDVTFLDLTLRLGQPYVFIHQGNCEHLVVFNDLRLSSVEDNQDIRDYPVVIQRYQKGRTLCRVCHTTTAKWYTRNDDLANEDPCFFCDNCFFMLHYDKNKKKLCNFEAYAFLDSNAVIMQ